MGSSEIPPKIQTTKALKTNVLHINTSQTWSGLNPRCLLWGDAQSRHIFSDVNHPQDTSRTSCLRPMGTIKPLPLKPHPHSHEAQRDNKAFLWPQCDYWQCRCTDQYVQTLPTAASSWCLQPMNSLLQPRLPDNFPLCCGGTPSESPAFLSAWLHACPFFIPSLCQSGFQDQVTQDITVFCILLN